MKKTKSLSTRLIAIVLSIVMCVTTLGAMPFSASAAPITPTDYTATVSGTSALTNTPDVKLTQKTIDYLVQTVHIENVSDLVTEGVTTVNFKAEMSYDGAVMQSASSTLTLDASAKDYEVTYPEYGKYETTLEFVKDGATACTMSAQTGLVAEEYNFAWLNASFPVIYFSLVSQEIATNANGDPVPTFVALERVDAYNWDALPTNVDSVPYATREQGTTKDEFFPNRTRMAAYIKDLYELCSDSFFNLYCVDNYAEAIPVLLYANNIPESNSHVYMLSDGSGTYSIFNNTYNSTDPQAIYDDMATEWQNLKAEVIAQGKFDYNMVDKYLGTYGQYIQELEKYAYVVAKEESNVEWWVGRVNDTFQCPDTTFLDSLKAESTDPTGCIKVKAMNTMLQDLQAKGDDSVNAFKAMYKFNDQMFADAQSQGKKVMLMLGTRVTSEQNFEDYAKYTMKYYGDDYVYYYKGHPGTPTALYPEKQTQLDNLGITDVESSIAAELILFFYPSIYLCGYNTTTFMSVENNDMACTLFNSNKANSQSKSYAGAMDSFASKVDLTNSYYEPYAAFCPDASKTYYLIEYNDTTKYAASIYNATDDIITNLISPALAAAYDYSVQDNGNVVASGTSNLVALPKMTSTATMTFSGWTDGTNVFPGGTVVQIDKNTTFTSVWTPVAAQTPPVTQTTTSNTTASAAPTVKSSTTFCYNGKAQKPKITVKNAQGVTLANGKDYSIVYSNSKSKKVGTYSYTVVYKGEYSSCANKKVTYTIGPKTKAKITKLTSKSKSFTVVWKKNKAATGYQVQYAKDKSFKTGKKTLLVKTNKTTSKTVKKLKKGTKYYVRVRTYKTVSGKKCYASWSTVKTVKIK